MSISKVAIKNYKSVRSCELNFNDINLLIGENGTGKTNILDAIRFFFGSLLRELDDENAYNFRNQYCNDFTISITFDFRHLRKISGRNRNREADSDYMNYYQWISRRKDCETLELHQIKGRPARWNRDRKYRQNIYNLFPMYFVDARQVNLTDWGALWDIVGDLMKVHRNKEARISEDMDKIKDNGDYKLEERFQRLSDAFAKADVLVKPFTPKQYASAISTLLFRGNVFAFKGGKLNDMSNGTSAFNYTNLLLEILQLISEYKIKDPIVILDEPEISLHHKLIDQMSARIFRCNGSIRFLIASHSPRFLKNVLRTERLNCEVIHVADRGGYTCAAPVLLFSKEPDDGRPRIFMTDQHANAYFSRYILSVEGASETEIFSNPYLQELFPALKDVDVMEGMSNDIVQRIISPKRRHFQTQCLLLVDMDKAVMKDKGSCRFVLSKKYFSEARPFENQYAYTPQRTEQFLQKKRIKAMAEKCRFHFIYPFFSCGDGVYREFLNLIKQYLLSGNVFVLKNTVEGTLINEWNIDDFWAFYGQWYSGGQWAELKETYEGMSRRNQVNYMRLLFHGKSDFLLNLDEIKALNPKIDPALYGLIERNRADKTNGWMTRWLNVSLCRLAGVDPDGSAAFFQFSQKAADLEKRHLMEMGFGKTFPELHALLVLIRSQLRTR